MSDEELENGVEQEDEGEDETQQRRDADKLRGKLARVSIEQDRD